TVRLPFGTAFAFAGIRTNLPKSRNTLHLRPWQPQNAQCFSFSSMASTPYTTYSLDGLRRMRQPSDMERRTTSACALASHATRFWRRLVMLLMLNVAILKRRPHAKGPFWQMTPLQNIRV